MKQQKVSLIAGEMQNDTAALEYHLEVPFKNTNILWDKIQQYLSLYVYSKE